MDVCWRMLQQRGRARDSEVLDGEGSSGVGRGNQSEGVQ